MGRSRSAAISAERALLRLGRLEGQHALERLADGRLAHAECDARLLLRCFPAQRNAQLVKEKFLENQTLVRLRAKRIQRLDRLRLRRKVDEVDRVAPGWKLVPREQLRGQRIGNRAAKIFKRRINDPPHHPRADSADRFVNRNDPADFGGVRFPGAEQFVFRIDHLDPAGAVRVQLRFPVEDDPLPGFEFSFEIVAVKKLAGKRAGAVPDEQVIHAAAGARITHQAAARNFRLHGIGLSWRNFADLCEPDAVLITERQVTEKVFERADAAFREQLRAVRSHAFQVHHFG